MLLDTGTLVAILIALAGSCFAIVIGFRRSFLLERELIRKNREVISLQSQLATARKESRQ